MASNSEVGHAKNVANLSLLISYVTAYGAIYNPAKAALTVASLNTLKTNAQNAIDDVSTKEGLRIDKTNARITAFSTLRSLATRILSATKASAVDKQVVADVNTLVRKIRGSRAGTITPPAPGEPVTDTTSVSQQSYDNLVQHLSDILNILSAQPGYNPNEADLQINGLKTYRDSLAAANTNVVSAATDVSNSRISRNDMLYNETTGLVIIASEVKAYVKSLFGASSPQYAQVKGIKFNTP